MRVFVCVISQAVNYEDVKNLNLGLSVRNKAQQYNGPGANSGANTNFGWGTVNSGSSSQGNTGNVVSGGGSFKTYPLKINVKNQPEGAAFDPKVKAIPISEGGHSININDVIARYPAIDGDTGKPAQNVRSVHTQTHTL